MTPSSYNGKRYHLRNEHGQVVAQGRLQRSNDGTTVRFTIENSRLAKANVGMGLLAARKADGTLLIADPDLRAALPQIKPPPPPVAQPAPRRRAKPPEPTADTEPPPAED